MNELKVSNSQWNLKNIVLGFQHLFAMFGATVLVPLLTGMNPSVALFCAGLGTLIFHVVTKGKVPVFLGSSFAFIGVIIIATTTVGNIDTSVEGYMSSHAYQNALSHISVGIICAGVVYLILSAIVSKVGVDKVLRVFPPIVTGPMIIVIGLTLAPTAFSNILNSPTTDLIPDILLYRWIIALSVVITVIIVSIFAKGFFKLVPIIFAIAVGYIVATCLGQVDYSGFNNPSALGFKLPNFTVPVCNLTSILIIAPVAIVTFMEHIGDITTNGAVVGKNFIKDPGLNKTLIGDGLATIAAGFLGGPPNTTYGENTGVLAVTKNYNPFTLRLAAIFAIIISFFGVFTTFLNSIPGPVMGGVSIILFGMIAAIGLRTLSEAQIDFHDSRNLIIISVMLVIGLGLPSGIKFSDTFILSNIFLSAIAGIVLNMIFFNTKLGRSYNK